MSDLSEWTPSVVLYHGNCKDGFTAAWIAHLKWGREIRLFQPMHYGQPWPALDILDDVLVTDFSFPAKELRRLAGECRSVVVLDHHATAQDSLEEFEAGAFSARSANYLLDQTALERESMVRIIAHFDMNRCGASMTWDFAHPGSPVPELVRYIEDHDIGLNKLPDTKEVSAAIGSYVMSFTTWDALAYKVSRLADEGRHILRYKQRNIREMLPYIKWVVIGGHTVPAMNMPPSEATEAGYIMLEEFPDAPFTATWYRFEKHFGWSLRSQPSRVNVAEVAKALGGGGHPCAAGFPVQASLVGGYEGGAAVGGIGCALVVPVTAPKHGLPNAARV